jgi:hypothetical protein
MRFASAPDNAGSVAFVLSGTNGGKFSVIGHQSGLIRLVKSESLKVDSSYRLTLQSPEELVSCAVFNPNGVNIAIGTNHGNIYLGSIREDSQGRPKVAFGRLDINGSAVGTIQTVTSMQFSEFDPIGSFLVSYDNGIVKTWQSSLRDEQFHKLLELQQHSKHASSGGTVPQFDMSEFGYQQYDIIDVFNMFENPHGLDVVSSEDKATNMLYQVSTHLSVVATHSIIFDLEQAL